MVILKKIEDNELDLFINGKLIYKRCLKTGESQVLDVMLYDKYMLMSIRDLTYENPNGLLSIKANLALKSTEEGGRRSGIISGYSPNHVFEYINGDQLLQTYIGDIIFHGTHTIVPGEEREVTVRFLLNQPIEKFLDKGSIWWIHEGAKQIGKAKII